METIQELLFSLQDDAYGDFQQKLTPTLPREPFIGVRVPAIRQLAKQLHGTEMANAFLSSLPHSYYDENMLHGLLISLEKDFDACIRLIEAFLPYVDNWAVCDCMNPKALKKHRDKLLPKIREWTASPDIYTCRFGIDMLMGFFLDEAFTPEIPEIAARIPGGAYYMDMALAWFFATALAKQWDAVIPYLADNLLSTWVHNKTIAKCRESYRISDAHKAYLCTLKRS